MWAYWENKGGRKPREEIDFCNLVNLIYLGEDFCLGTLLNRQNSFDKFSFDSNEKNRTDKGSVKELAPKT